MTTATATVDDARASYLATGDLFSFVQVLIGNPDLAEYRSQLQDLMPTILLRSDPNELLTQSSSVMQAAERAAILATALGWSAQRAKVLNREHRAAEVLSREAFKWMKGRCTRYVHVALAIVDADMVWMHYGDGSHREIGETLLDIDNHRIADIADPDERQLAAALLSRWRRKKGLRGLRNINIETCADTVFGRLFDRLRRAARTLRG